eukprot:CAMPEP_0203640796 /NCGR_PEP_ID=MMETSP0088-20131115/6207_1 /ASSEMBLY_ACC=CAM_ASM_001087 /TAXON_ID=426623 /ORGANISM="Chaetoceros affinis, Strain CCMP159" /LENGTH=33 /DNA_ID= /DNA_START= /DNA_END= /DNA_ORIENTATION=
MTAATMKPQTNKTELMIKILVPEEDLLPLPVDE